MGPHPVTDADLKVMEDATGMWHRFMMITKWAVISTAVLLILMAIFLV